MEKKILVIEDTESILNAVKTILKMEGFNVITAKNGKHGIELAESHLPDLIISDIMMPEVNGYEVLKKLKENHSTSLIPFIFLTAKTSMAELRHGMGLGADDYIPKPFTSEELVHSVKTRLEKYHSFIQKNEEKIKYLTNNLSYVIPHEFNTPLTSIIGFSELLVDISNQNNIKEIGQSIINSSKRLERLIKNFILYSQLEILNMNHQKTDEIQKLVTPNPSAVIRGIALNKAITFNRTNTLFFDLAKDKKVFISPENLGKIIEELTDNAFKFSDINTNVEIRTIINKNKYYIHITNTGKEFNLKDIKDIGAYMQFQREKDEQQGFGLGLVISKKLTELHQGYFNIFPVKDKTTISLSFNITD